MTTALQAYSVVRSRLENSVPSLNGAVVGLRWQNESEPLPDDPAPFVFTEFTTERAFLASFGGGRGANRYRHPGLITSYVFVPNGMGLPAAVNIAEQVAAVFRSYRDSDISCFEATVYPGGAGSEIKPRGLNSEVGNYFYAVAETGLFFDLIG